MDLSNRDEVKLIWNICTKDIKTEICETLGISVELMEKYINDAEVTKIPVAVVNGLKKYVSQDIWDELYIRSSRLKDIKINFLGNTETCDADILVRGKSVYYSSNYLRKYFFENNNKEEN